MIPQVSYTHTPRVPTDSLKHVFFSLNENHFQTKVFVFNRGQPSDINSGHTPIINFFLVDHPPMYINGQPSEYINWTTLRRLILYGQTLRCISYGQPSEHVNWTTLRRLILYGQPSDVYHMDNPLSISIGQSFDD